MLNFVFTALFLSIINQSNKIIINLKYKVHKRGILGMNDEKSFQLAAALAVLVQCFI